MTNAPAPEPSSTTPPPSLHRPSAAPVFSDTTANATETAASAPTPIDGRRARLRPAPLPWAQGEERTDSPDDAAARPTAERDASSTSPAPDRRASAGSGAAPASGGRETPLPPAGLARGAAPTSPNEVDSPAPERPAVYRPQWEADDDLLGEAVRQRKARPTEGWRGFCYSITNGRINPGLSQAEVRLRKQLERIQTRLHGAHSTAVISLKGGVGKTTVSATLGLGLAEYRGDRVIAMDANPDAGTLGDRLVGEKLAAQSTVRDLLDNISNIRSSTDLARFTHLTRRLQVLTSEQDPELSEAFSAEDYESVLKLLSKYFEVIITDSGTGLMHSALQATLTHADSLVIVGAPTHAGASRARKTMHWLATPGHEALLEHVIVLLSRDRQSAQIDESVIRGYFDARCRAVVELPPDPHLQAGSQIDFDALAPGTRDAVLELAATVADNFNHPRHGGLATHGFRPETSRE